MKWWGLIGAWHRFWHILIGYIMQGMAGTKDEVIGLIHILKDLECHVLDLI